MKEKIFYFSWVFIRAVLEIDYTKVCFRTFKFNSYTEDLFNFRVLMYNKYKRSVSNEEARPYAEGTLQSWGLFERLLMMKEFDKVKNFVKTLPDWSNFYIELIRIIKVGDDYKVVGWLKEKGIDLTKMWEPTEHQKELMIDIKELMIDIDVTWVWTNVFIEFLEDEETFGKHHWEYGKVIEILNRPRYKEKVYDALDKALQIEQLENRQDLVDHLRTFSDIAETHFNKAKYKKWVIYPNNVKWMKSWAQEVETTNKVYPTILLKLFHNNIYLIDEIVGSSDDEIAKKIKQWAKERDKFGKPLIENPENNLRTAFAKALKTNNLIKCSIDIFRRKLS